MFSEDTPYLTGVEFNKQNTRKLYKLTNLTHNHNGFQFKEGLNIDTIPLRPYLCSPGGLYFTFGDCFYNWLNYRGGEMIHVWDVTVPDDALVFMESHNKIKADRIILSHCRLIEAMVEWLDPAICQEAFALSGNNCKYTINGLSEAQQLVTITAKPWMIRYINNPTVAVQVEAVRSQARVITLIKNPSDEALLVSMGYPINSPLEVQQMIQVHKDSEAIKDIDSPSEMVQIIAIRSNAFSIRHIQHPSHKVQIEAITNNPSAIEYIDNPSIEVQLEAIKHNPSTIEYIGNPSIEVQLEAIQRDPQAIKYLESPSVEAQIKAIQLDRSALSLIKNLAPEAKAEAESLEAVYRDPLAIQGIPNPSVVIQCVALRGNRKALDYIRPPYSDAIICELIHLAYMDGYAIKDIKNPPRKVQLSAVRRHGYAIQYILDPCLEVQIEAIKQTAFALQFIKDPCEEVQLLAVRKNRKAIKFIPNPSLEVQLVALM